MNEEPCILPMVASTHVAKASRPRRHLGHGRLADVVRTSVDRIRGRLDRLADGLRDTDPGRIAALLDGDRMRHLAAEVDGISQTLTQLGDLLSPDEPDARWVSPRGILESLLAKLSHAAGPRALPRVVLDVAEGHAIHADPVLIRRILETLLANAIEASGGVGEVTVTSVEYADAIEIEVADSGPFRELASVDRVAAERAGGSLDILACAEGGTAVTLRLPHRQAAARAA